MMKKISSIIVAILMVVMLVSCKNTTQKLQEYVTAYNNSAATFKSDNVTLTTARGYIKDNKIELRFETDLEHTKPNEMAVALSFPKLIKQMLIKDQIPRDLVKEGVRFDVYFLADDNTVLSKEIIDNETLAGFLK